VSRLRLCTDTPLKCTMTQQALCRVDRAIYCYTEIGKGIDLDAAAPISIGDLIALLRRRQVEGFLSAIMVTRPTVFVKKWASPIPTQIVDTMGCCSHIWRTLTKCTHWHACLCGFRCSQELSMAVLLKENKSAGDENQKMNAMTTETSVTMARKYTQEKRPPSPPLPSPRDIQRKIWPVPSLRSGGPRARYQGLGRQNRCEYSTYARRAPVVMKQHGRIRPPTPYKVVPRARLKRHQADPTHLERY
jgi:hypothetical protein